MNTANQVDSMIAVWKNEGLNKSQICINIAEASLGWSYVFGARGALCTPVNRNNARREDYPTIITKCQVCNGSKQTCTGCKWYPGGSTRFFDCRGFTYWVLLHVGVKVMGAGATSQWNDDNNWEVKGPISEMPMDKVCCVFKQDGKKMSHTGLHIGGGQIIHCSGEVKRGKTTDRGWTHYAIPNGLDGDIPVPPTPSGKPTIRKGSTGEYVVECQNDLLKLGYSLAPYGADGKFGAVTESAVKEFQKTHKDQNGNPLKVDGIVGDSTWYALDEAISPSPVPVEKLYTVHIPHLNETQANSLLKNYPESWKTEE